MKHLYTMLLPVARYIIFLVLFSCHSVVVNAVKEIGCEGYGDELHDTCPTGMFCTEPSSGICKDCDYCLISQILAREVINKCFCQGGDSFKLCMHQDSNDEEDIVIRNRTDLTQQWMKDSFDSVVGDSDNPYLECPSSSFTPPVIPAVVAASTEEDTPTVGSTTTNATTSLVTLNKDNKLCKDLTSPTNGIFLRYNNTVGGTAVVRCDEGFNMNGTSELSCEEGGWIQNVPTCYPKTTEIQDGGSHALIITIIPIVLVIVLCVVVAPIIVWRCRKKGGACHEQDSYQPARDSYSRPASGEVELAQDVEAVASDEGANETNSMLPTTGVSLDSVEGETPSYSSENETGTHDSCSSTSLELQVMPHSNTQATLLESEDSANSIAQKGTHDSCSSTSLELQVMLHSNTQATLLESEDSANSIAQKDQCTCQLSTVFWHDVALSSLLNNPTFKKELVKTIFQNADNTTESTNTQKSICSMTDPHQFIEELRGGLCTFEINDLKTMEATLRYLESERYSLPSVQYSKETIGKLLQKLSKSHKQHCPVLEIRLT